MQVDQGTEALLQEDHGEVGGAGGKAQRRPLVKRIRRMVEVMNT